MQKEYYWLVEGGQGGFLNPPEHPECKYHLANGRDSMALTYALTNSFVSEQSKEKARRLLNEWENKKQSLSSLVVQEWIKKVNSYFGDCYRDETIPEESGVAWHITNLIIDDKRNPLENVNLHAGIHLIRQYYPDYIPKEEDFK